MPDADLRRVLHEIPACPQCGQRHAFPVLVRIRHRDGPSVPLFGGPAADPSGTSTLAFTCPTTGKIVSAAVPAPPDTEIVGPGDIESPESAAGPPSILPPAATAEEQEYAEWIRVSRATAVDFCKTMLAAATGAVPIYFAILQYLGAAAAPSWTTRLRAAPPLLFLAAAIVFALALRPRLADVRPGDFASFRAHRLKQLNRSMLGGLALFAAGLLIAIAIAVAAMR